MFENPRDGVTVECLDDLERGSKEVVTRLHSGHLVVSEATVVYTPGSLARSQLDCSIASWHKRAARWGEHRGQDFSITNIAHQLVTYATTCEVIRGAFRNATAFRSETRRPTRRSNTTAAAEQVGQITARAARQTKALV